MKPLIGAIDQGTTSTRFILYDSEATVVASHQLEFSQIHPRAGWVEHDPLEILETVRVCIAECILQAKAKEYDVAESIRALGITNQRETALFWRKSTGQPLHNAIVWMDARTVDVCRSLEERLDGGKNHFKSITGLPISTYFSAVKLLWLLENVPAISEAVNAGDALFGTIDTWLIWNMTGGSNGQGLHVTDCSNASRTMLMNLHTLTWDSSILETLGIDLSVLPRIVSNSELIGTVCPTWPLAGTVIAGCLGDQHAALLGQRCHHGQAKSTYGTGCFLLYHTGPQPTTSNHGLLTTLAFKLGADAPVQYALEGSIAIAGAAVQWLRDSLGVIERAADIEELAGRVDDCGGLYFVPAFNGLFAPRWRDDARGVLIGITRYTSKAHIARAVLESICFQAVEVLSAMHSDVHSSHGLATNEFVLRVDGGATVNNLLMQLQADLLGSPVLRPFDVETTALGAAYAAGLGVGLWTEDDIFQGIGKANEPTTFRPSIEESERRRRIASWELAVERSYGLADLGA